MSEETTVPPDLEVTASITPEHGTASRFKRHEARLPFRNVLVAVVRGLPTLIVLGMLAVLAYWGHHHGWKLPKFSELVAVDELPVVAWCDEHGVPEADCISCNADLMPKGELFGWCEEHGVHECVLHHPEVAQLSEPPTISQSDLDRAAHAIKVLPRTDNDPACKMHLRRIQFPSIEAVDQAGIDIALVDRAPVIETIQATGEIVYDATRVAHLSSRASGAVWRVEKEVGDTVREGDVLALVDAVEVGRLKSQLLQSLVQLELDSKVVDRLAPLAGGAIPGKRLDEAKSAKAASEVALQSSIQALANLGLQVSADAIVGRPTSEVRGQLRYLGLPSSIEMSIDPARSSANLIPVVSPRDGVVVMRNAVAGEVVETSDVLFTLADTSQMWLQLNARLEQAERLSIDQKVTFYPDGSEREAVGKITWISTDVDSETRTVRVRASLPNQTGRLRNETFGAGEIILREEPDAIVVPNDVIHWEGCCHVAFVRDKDYFSDDSYKVFHTRSVRPGAKMGDNIEVIAGLLPGEVVVAKGSGILRAELLKGNLGAG